MKQSCDEVRWRRLLRRRRLHRTKSARIGNLFEAAVSAGHGANRALPNTLSQSLEAGRGSAYQFPETFALTELVLVPGFANQISLAIRIG